MAQPEFDTSTVADDPESRPGGIPLYVWVMGAAIVAVPFGLYMPRTLAGLDVPTQLDLFPNLIIRALKALATPLVVLAILSAIVTNDIRGRQGGRMMFYYFVNTIVAITIGLVASNLIHPGVGAKLSEAPPAAAAGPESGAKAEPKGLTKLLYELIPESIGDSFAKNHLAQLVMVTLALGIGLAKIRDEQRKRGETSHQVVIDLVTVGFELLMRVLLWVVALVPLAVFGVVAANIMRSGLEIFQSLVWFIAVVLGGLACQVAWYLIQLGIFARMSPVRFLRGAANVMATSFSTASTGATMPVTLRSLQGPLGVSRQSSQLAACVGTNFNNDGTALYQAAVVLFMAQALGRDMSFMDQIVIVLTTVVASIGAGCIPSGGFVTLPLIFAAVALPAEQIPFLLTIDWFLDRCRTTSNVLGDMTVAVLLDQTADRADLSDMGVKAG
ncbi:dicarboxylate/amino acid:cation symporter [Tundrisphaera lichenicola]|uniref:dicarboxylate/amino acid:cation symporter n=1 Tax=Tundrisphaera lichenicola TaxID=2029860 RepID=UPI003EBF2899